MTHAGDVTAAEGGEPADYTRIPGELDTKFEQLDLDGALRATIINPGDTWTRTAQKGLLSAETRSLGTEDLLRLLLQGGVSTSSHQATEVSTPAVFRALVKASWATKKPKLQVPGSAVDAQAPSGELGAEPLVRKT